MRLAPWPHRKEMKVEPASVSDNSTSTKPCPAKLSATDTQAVEPAFGGKLCYFGPGIGVARFTN